VISRRKFFGTAAAATAAVVVPTSARTFARTLERPEPEPVFEAVPTNATVHLYFAGRRVHSETVTLTITKIGESVHYGVGEAFAITSFVGRTDDCGIEIDFMGVPIERKISYEGCNLPIVVNGGNTLTLHANHTGFLKIS